MNKYNIPKQIAKRCLQYIAAMCGKHNLANSKPQLLILMYHRILPTNDKRTALEEPGMIVSPDVFRDHMQLVSNYFEIISISKWMQLKEQNLPLPKKACAITFDDGWADNFEYAYPILKELEIPATIYLVANMIGTNKVFWTERLMHIIDKISKEQPHFWSSPKLSWIRNLPTTYNFTDSAPSKNQTAQIINSAKKFTDTEINNHLDTVEIELKINTKNSPSPAMLNWEQVLEMMQSSLIDVGSHTCTHTRLDGRISSAILEEEIIHSKNIIETNTGNPVKTFCFPNGDFTDEALALVKKHYIAAVTTKSGWNNNDSNNHLLQRVGLHKNNSNDTISFLSKLSGWM